MKVVSCFFGFLLITFFSAANSYSVFEENGKVGLKNAEGQVLIPAEYEALGWSNGAFSVVDNVIGYYASNRWGLISISNHRVTKAEYEELLPSEGSLLIARKKSKVSLRIAAGCINTSGKEIIPFQYDGLKISALRAIVFTKIGNQYKYGLIDLTNKTLIPQQYQHIRSIGTLRYAVLNFEGKTALYTDAGKQITEFNIDSLSSFRKNYAILYQGINRGLIDREGMIKLEPKYRDITIRDDGSVRVRDTNEWLFLDGQNKLIRQTKADSVVAAEKNLLKVETASVIQLTNQELSPITPTQFSAVGKFANGKALYKWGHQQGIVLSNGKILLPAIYHHLIIDKNFILASQRAGGKDSWNLLDSMGVKRINKTYEQILPFNGKYFAVKNRGFWGALNFVGQDVIACSYDSLMEAKDSLVVVKFRSQYGIINFKEEWIVAPQPNRLKLVGNKRYIEFTVPTTFLKSTDGNVIYFSDNRLDIHPEFLVEHLPSGARWKIDMHGVIVDRQVQPEESTEKIFEEAEGMRAIKRNGKYGFIDSRGRLRIANRYEDVQPFSEGLAPVKILGKWGYINMRDNIAVQPVYEEVFAFKNGFAHVRQKDLFGLIDKNGKLVLPVRYEAIEVLPTKNVLIQQGKLWGLADATGRTVIHPKYDLVKDLGNGYVIVVRGEKYGVVTQQGLSTIPLMYDYIAYDTFNNFFVAMKKAVWTDVKF
jgi:hypothetical protein